jgi:hypothetical protein
VVGNGNNVYISTYNAPHTWSKKSTITLVMYVAQLCKSIFNTYPALHEKWDPEEANKDQQTSHGIGAARAKTPGGSPWTRTRTTLKNPQLATFFRIISAQQSKEVVPWRVEAGDQYNVPVSSLLEWGRNDDVRAVVLAKAKQLEKIGQTKFVALAPWVLPTWTLNL